MQRSHGRSLAAAAAALVATALILSTADGAALTRQTRGVDNVRWAAGLPKCNMGGICGFRIVGSTYDGESNFVQTCHCIWNCEKDYFNLATRVTKFRCQA